MKSTKQSRINEWEPVLKKSNNCIISTDMNGNIKDLYMNENLKTYNSHEMTAVIKPSSYNEHIALCDELELTTNHQTHMNKKINYTSKVTSKLKPLTIPNEMILFENDETDDDITPEYPLKEGDMFFRKMANIKDSLKSQIYIKPTEQKGNVSCDLSLPSPFIQTSVEDLLPATNISQTQQQNLQINTALIAEHVKLSDDTLGLPKYKSRLPELFKSEKEHMFGKSHTELVGLKYENAATNDSNPMSECADNKILLTDNNVKYSNNSINVTTNDNNDYTNVEKIEDNDGNVRENAEIKNSKEIPYLSPVTEQICGNHKLPCSQGQSHLPSLISTTDSNSITNNSNHKNSSTATESLNENRDDATKLKKLFNTVREKEENKSERRVYTVKESILMMETKTDDEKNASYTGHISSLQSLNTGHNVSLQSLDTGSIVSLQSLDTGHSVSLRSLDTEMLNYFYNIKSVDSETLVRSLNLFNMSDLSNRHDVLENKRPSVNNGCYVNNNCRSEADGQNKSSCENSSGGNTATETSSCNIISNNTESSSSSTTTTTHGKNNNTYKTVNCDISTDQSTSRNPAKTHVKHIDDLSGSNEQQSQSFKGTSDRDLCSDNTSETQCMSSVNGKISTVIDERQSINRSVAHVINNCSTSDQNYRKQSKFLKSISLNLEEYNDSNANTTYLDAVPETQRTDPLELSKVVSKSSSNEHIKNVSSEFLNSKAHVSCSIPKNINSVSNSQINTSGNDRSLIFEVHNGDKLSDLQEISQNELVQQDYSRQFVAIENTNSTENKQVCITSKECIMSVGHRKDSFHELTASQTSNDIEHVQQNHLKQKFATKYQICRVKSPVETVNNPYTNDEPNDKKLVRERRLLRGRTVTYCKADSSVLPSKRPLLNRVETMSPCKVLTSYETTETTIAEETEHKVPMKKLRRMGSCPNDQILTPNGSAKTITDDLRKTMRKRTLSPEPHKRQSTVEHRIDAFPPLIISLSEQKIQLQSTIQKEASVKERKPSLEDDSHTTFVRSTSQTIDTNYRVGNYLPLVHTPSVSFGSHADNKFQLKSDSHSKVPHLFEKDPPEYIKKSTKKSAKANKILENGNTMNAQHTSEEMKMNLIYAPFSLTHHCNDSAMVDQVNSNSYKPLPPKSNYPDVNNAITTSPHLILHASERNSDHYNNMDWINQQLPYITNNSNRHEQYQDKSSISKVNAVYSEASGSNTKRFRHNMAQHVPWGINCINNSLAQPRFDPLWANMYMMSQPSTEINHSHVVPSCHIPSVPHERAVTRIGNVNIYNNQITIPSNFQVLNQRIPSGLVPRPVQTVMSDNLNMFRHAQAIQTAHHNKAVQHKNSAAQQQNNAAQHYFQPDDKMKYPSWVQIPREQTLANEASTSPSKLYNSQRVINTNSNELCETAGQKLHHSHSPLAYNINDYLAGSRSLRRDITRSPNDHEKDETVTSPRQPSPPCEPLDLSKYSETVQGAHYPVSIQTDLNLQSQRRNTSLSQYSESCKLHLPMTPSLHLLRSEELHDTLSSNHMTSQVHTARYSRELAPSCISKVLTSTRTVSTNSLPISSIEPSNNHNFPRLEMPLQYNNTSKEGNLQTFSRTNLKQISQVAPSCKRYENISFANSPTTVDKDIPNTVKDNYVTTSASSQNHSVVVSSAHKACVSSIETNTMTPSGISVSQSPPQYSSAEQFTSTSDSTKSAKANEGVSSLDLTEVTTSQALYTTPSTNVTGQKIRYVHSGNPSVAYAIRYPFVDNSSYRLPPLPVKDFFTHSPKENAYSSLLMAKITSQNKTHSNPQKVREDLSQNQQHKPTECILEISNFLQSNNVIDLTEGYDDCDVVSISSKDSLDDDSRMEFLEVTMLDPTPGLNATYLNKSEVTVVQLSKNLPPSDVAGETHTACSSADASTQNACISADANNVQIEVHVMDRPSFVACNGHTQKSSLTPTNISTAEVISPSLIINECRQVRDTEYHNEKFVLNTAQLDSDSISDTGQIMTVTQTSENPGMTHHSYHQNSSEAMANSRKLPLAEHCSSSSHHLKIAPEFKDIMVRKLKNAVASRVSSGKQSSEELLSSMTTQFNQEYSAKVQQPEVINCPTITHPNNMSLSERDNSTQRAAATLLELSTNPLYNTYMISPETSNNYQEKIYHVHPTLDDDDETDVDDKSHDQHDNSSRSILKTHHTTGTVTHRSGTRTNRRVGRPLKDQYYASDPANSEVNTSATSQSGATFCVSSPNSVLSVRTHSSQDSNINTIPIQSKHINVPEHPLSIINGLSLKHPIVNTTCVFSSSAPLTMSRVLQNGMSSDVSHQMRRLQHNNAITALRSSYSSSVVNVSTHRAQMLTTRLTEILTSVSVPSNTSSIETNRHIYCEQGTNVHYSSPNSNLNISSTVSRVPPHVTSSSAQLTNTYTSRAGVKNDEVNNLNNTHIINTPNYKSTSKHTKNVFSLPSASSNVMYPQVVKMNSQTLHRPSNFTNVFEAVKSTDILNSLTPHSSIDVRNNLPFYSEDDMKFIRNKAISSVSYAHTPVTISSTLKGRTHTTEKQKKTRRQRKTKVQEQIQLKDEHSSEMTSETESLISITESASTQMSIIGSPGTQRSLLESPTIQMPISESPVDERPLHIVTDSDDTITNNNNLSDSNLSNNLTDIESRKHKKKKKMRRVNKKHNNIPCSLNSEIDDVLQQLNSNEHVSSIVVRTSFKDGLHVLSLQSEEDADFCQRSPQNGDQIVPLNLVQSQDNFMKEDNVVCKRKNSSLDESTCNAVSQQLQYEILPTLINSEPSGSVNSTEQVNQASQNFVNIEDLAEIEKEKAVTSLLAEMMHSKFKGYHH